MTIQEKILKLAKIKPQYFKITYIDAKSNCADYLIKDNDGFELCRLLYNQGQYDIAYTDKVLNKTDTTTINTLIQEYTDIKRRKEVNDRNIEINAKLDKLLQEK